MVTPAFVPQRGDLVWMEFGPQRGREQRGFRPVLILSPEEYHRRRGMAYACPVTSTVKGRPFEVPLPAKGKIKGAVLADQMKAVDLEQRKIKPGGKAPQAVVDRIWEILQLLLGDEQ